MKVGVTGGSGFIGSHVVDALIEAGHEVVVMDYHKAPHRDDVDYKDVDIVDTASVLNATAGLDVVFHLAAVSNVNYAFEQPVYTVQLNVGGTANVLEAARHNRIKRVIFAGTVWTYSGTVGEQVNEDSPIYMPGAGHVYTSTKISGEFLCMDYQKLYGLEFTILRYGIPYGPRMRPELVMPIFIRKALKGEPLTIQGDGSQFRNFVYVADMARAHALVLEKMDASRNQIFNLEGREKITIREMAEAIRDVVGDHVKIVHTEARPGDYKGKAVSRQKVLDVLGWEATTPFREGMGKTIEHFRNG